LADSLPLRARNFSGVYPRPPNPSDNRHLLERRVAAMEEIPQVVTNREALKRILAMLVGMAEMGGGTTLPRHLYRAILLLLRPAESAVRRLIIAAARGIVVTLPPLRPRKLKPKISDTVAAMRRLGLAVTLSREDFARYQAELKAAERRAAMPRAINLSLLDPLKNPLRIRRRYTPAHAAPRILSLFSDAPYHRLPPPPSPTDPIGAAKLMLRMEALGRALDDLPAQAQRFARWRARNAAADARVKEGLQPWRPRRFWPLRGGRPPGGRLKCYDPDARRPAPQEHPRDRRDSGALPFDGALCAGSGAPRHVVTARLGGPISTSKVSQRLNGQTD
jgi:hypothetical protein